MSEIVLIRSGGEGPWPAGRLPRPMPFLFDLRPPPDRLPLFGTYCSPVPFFPVGEPERERPPERLPPLVSPGWLSLAASLASGAAAA